MNVLLLHCLALATVEHNPSNCSFVNSHFSSLLTF
ncbi:hypothetical protein POPTR_005G150425v4 [Populus trichocarpa]|uniref:Uncharacterized protein n=1 Tax=Populus trichocarpa TaxID=3694 RepID=A0ACC0T0F6_POPTR|nr:hypothetical protein BDE02_05G127700 [Populus trichocarpa]KAI9394868.1 hypothetical protein POPTR_005G150425v4 [Populus trichocarpa]